MSDVPSSTYKHYLDRDHEDAYIPKRTRVRWKKQKLLENQNEERQVEHENIVTPLENSTTTDEPNPADDSMPYCQVVEDQTNHAEDNNDYRAEPPIEPTPDCLGHFQDAEYWDLYVDRSSETCGVNPTEQSSGIATAAFYDCVEGPDTSDSSSEDESDDGDKTTFQFLNDFFSKEECFSEIDVPVGASRADILIMILKYTIVTRAAKEHVEFLFQLVNNIFRTPILPDSSYFIEKLFNPDIRTKLHAICPHCKAYAGGIRLAESKKNELRCRTCNVVIDVSKLNNAGFFFTFDMKTDFQKIIEKNSKYYYQNMTENRENQSYRDIYDGRKYKKMKKKLKEMACEYFATGVFNTDGAPIFNSSTLSIWPIQMLINELPLDERFKNVILCGLWFGRGKPDMNIFMEAFIEQLNELDETGIECNVEGQKRCIKFYCLCCCVDSMARPPMQGLVNFSGYYGCSWCLHKGKYSHVYNCMTYPVTTRRVKLRTHNQAMKDIEDYVNARSHPRDDRNLLGHGFKFKASMTNLKYFDIIEGFVVDFMHNIALGVARQFAKYWFDSPTQGTHKKEYAITSHELNKLDDMILKLAPHSQVGRLTRSIHERKWWKSREWESWVLYYSLPMMSTVLEGKYVQHWSLLVEALYILLKEEITSDELDRSDALLHEFVYKAHALYGEKAMTYNVHQLLHLSSSVANWGPLWSHNGYPFENGIGEVVKTIFAANGMAYQVQRFIAYKKSFSYLQSLVAYSNCSPFVPKYLDKLDRKMPHTLKTQTCRYIGRSSVAPDNVIALTNIPSENCVTFSRIVMNKCVYASSKKKNKRSDNSFASLENGSYVQCVLFLYDLVDKKDLLIARQIRTEKAYNTIEKIVSIDDNIFVIEVKNLRHPCIVIKVEDQTFLSAVPNNYHCK